MKRLVKFERTALLLLSVLVMAVTGCKKEEKLEQPKINLDIHEIEVAAAGGEFSVGYSLENPYAGAVLELSKNADWISGLSFDETCVTFSVDSNFSVTESREAMISLAYSGVRDSITVIQAASQAVDDGAELTIGIEVNSVTPVSVNATFTPSDKEATYHIMTMTKADFDNVGSDDDLIATVISDLKEQAGGYGLSVEEYLEGYVLKIGDLTKDMPSLQPDTEYYVIAFGISVSGESTGPLFKEEAKTAQQAEGSDLTFELKAEVNGASAELSVKPSDATARYYQSYIAETMLEYLETDVKGVVEYMLQEEIYYGTESGMSIYEVVDGMSYYGEVSYTVSLYNSTPNILYAAAISETGDIISEVASTTFAMESVASDNEITVEVTDINVDKAVLHVSTTNMDPYVIGIAEASKWAGYTDEQITGNVLFMDDKQYNGDYTTTLGNLKGGTDYVVAVFGYEADMVTTEVVKKYFCTQTVGNMEDLEFEFKIDDITPFGATVSVSATPETNMYYWYVRPASMTEQEIKDDIDAIIQNYLAAGMISSRLDYFKVTGSRGTDQSVITSLESGKDYRAFAIGIEEERGMYATPMAFSEVFTTKVRQDVDIEVELAVENYYDCNELIAAGYTWYQSGAGKALVTLKSTVSGSDDCKNFYFHMVMADISDENEYTDDAVIDILFDYGFLNLERQQVFAPYDQVCTLVAVGLDKDGNTGKVFRKNITLTKDGVSDADTYEPLYAPSENVRKTDMKRF